MYLEDVYQLAQSQQLQVSRDSAFGVYRGWPVMFACMGRGLKTHDDRPIGIRVLLCFSSNISKPLLQQIKKHAKHLASQIYLVNGRELQIWFSESTKPDAFYPALDQMLDFFAVQQLAPSTVCPFCHAGDCDATAAWGTSYLPVHRACFEQAVEGKKSKIENNALNGSYVTGFLGALVGSFIGALPALITAWLGGPLPGLYFILIPIISYKGYQIARGRMNRGSIVFSVLCSLFEVFVIVELIYYQMISSYLNLYPSIFSTIAISFEVGDFFSILGNLAFSLVFMPAGVLLSILLLSLSGTPHLKTLDTNLSTILPYHTTARTSLQAPQPAPLKPGDAGPATVAATTLAEKDPRGN